MSDVRETIADICDAEIQSDKPSCYVLADAILSALPEIIAGTHDDTVTALQAKVARLEAALKDIANPLGYLRREAEKNGDKFVGGIIAVSIAGDPEFIKDIARKALDETQ